jgi:hypothetical protein
MVRDCADCCTGDDKKQQVTSQSKSQVWNLSLRRKTALTFLFFLTTITMGALYLQGNHGDCVYHDPPPTVLRRRPSVVVISIESLRKDLFNSETFPQTTKLLEAFNHEEGNSCATWDTHESTAFHSDQAFAALYHSVPGATTTQIRAHRDNKEIKSWTMEALRLNGFYLHRITPWDYNYCWTILEGCDLHRRDFDTIKVVSESPEPSDRKVLKEAANWLGKRFADRKAKHYPFLLSLHLPGTSFPYGVDPNFAKTLEYFEPSLTETEVHHLQHRAHKLDNATIASLRPKLLNRVKVRCFFRVVVHGECARIFSRRGRRNHAEENKRLMMNRRSD